jgi:hypothetical protein
MHYFPSTYNEVCNCVLQQTQRATVAGRQAKSLVLGRFQHRSIVDEIRTWPVDHTVKMAQGPATLMGLPYEVIGEFECKVMLA